MRTLLLSLILGIYFTSFGQKVEISEKIDAFGMSKDIRLANICPDKNGQVYYNMDLAPILYSIEDGKEQKIVKWDDLKSKIAKTGLMLFKMVLLNNTNYLVLLDQQKENSTFYIAKIELATGQIDLSQKKKLFATEATSIVDGYWDVKVCTNSNFLFATYLYPKNGDLYYAGFNAKDQTIAFSGKENTGALAKDGLFQLGNTAIETAVSDNGDAFVLVKNIVTKVNAKIALKCYAINNLNDSIKEFVLPIDGKFLVDVGIKGNNDHYGVVVLNSNGKKSETTGLQVFELQATSVNEIINKQFDLTNKYDIENQYTGKPSGKTNNKSISLMKAVDLFFIIDTYYLIAEQHFYYENNGNQVDEPQNISIFEIKNNEISKIVTHVKADRMYVGSILASKAILNNNKIEIITSTNEAAILSISYNPATGKLINKTFEMDINEKKVIGKMNYDRAYIVNQTMILPMMHIMKGVRIVKVVF